MEMLGLQLAVAKLVHFGFNFVHILIFLPDNFFSLNHIRQLQGRIVDIK